MLSSLTHIVSHHLPLFRRSPSWLASPTVSPNLLPNHTPPFLLPAHNLFMCLWDPFHFSHKFWSLKRIISTQCLCSASGEVSQLQTRSPPADSAGLISLAFNSPTVHKGSHLNASQNPYTGSCISHMLLRPLHFAQSVIFQPCTESSESQSELIRYTGPFSLLTFDYHTYIMCVYAAIFLMPTEIYAV